MAKERTTCESEFKIETGTKTVRFRNVKRTWDDMSEGNDVGADDNVYSTNNNNNNKP